VFQTVVMKSLELEDTRVGHILQQCKIMVISTSYWSSRIFFFKAVSLFHEVPFFPCFYSAKQRQKRDTAEANNNNTNTQGKIYKGGVEREETIRRKKQLKTEIAALPAARDNSPRELIQAEKEGRQDWKA